MRGKKVCEQLRGIRCRIAAANDIDYTPAECTYEGECQGTCPRCESELRYIERQLHRRRALGKAVVVAGLTLGAASFVPMRAQPAPPDTVAAPVPAPPFDAAPGDTTAVVVRGRIVDAEDGEPCIGATILLEGTKFGTCSDLDGNFAIRVPKGSRLKILNIGYEDYEYEVTQSVAELLVKLLPVEMLMGEVVVGGVRDSRSPLPEIFAPKWIPTNIDEKR